MQSGGEYGSALCDSGCAHAQKELFQLSIISPTESCSGTRAYGVIEDIKWCNPTYFPYNLKLNWLHGHVLNSWFGDPCRYPAKPLLRRNREKAHERMMILRRTSGSALYANIYALAPITIGFLMRFKEPLLLGTI